MFEVFMHEKKNSWVWWFEFQNLHHWWAGLGTYAEEEGFGFHRLKLKECCWFPSSHYFSKIEKCFCFMLNLINLRQIYTYEMRSFHNWP